MPLGTVSRIEILLETEVPLIRDEPVKGEVVAHKGASSNPCCARKGALKGSRLERAAS